MFLSFFFTVFLPILLFQNANFVQLGPFYILVFLLCTAIAILRYQMFSFRAFATKAVLFLLFALLFLQLFLFDNTARSLRDFWATQGVNLELALGLLTFLFSLYLGGLVFWRNRRSATHRLFLLLSVLIDIYLVVNFLSLHPPGATPESQLFWIRIVMFITSFIGPTLVLLVYTFPREALDIKLRFLLPLLALMTAAAISALGPWTFTAITYPAGRPVPIPGPGMPMFLLDFVGLFILSFVILAYKYRHTTGELKRPLGYVLTGVITTFSFMALTTVIAVVVFKTAAVVWLGPLSAAVLMAFLAAAILKYQLFSIRLMFFEFLIALLTIVLVIHGALTGTLPATIFKIFFVSLVGVLGVLLTKTMRHEIEQREEIARLSMLAEANQKLRDLDRHKTEFLNIAAHQLRTPVSVIKNYIAMLGDGDYGAVNPEVREVHGNIGKSAEWLVRLADEFLNIAHLEQGVTKFHFTTLDVAHLIQSVVDELSDRALAKGLKLVWRQPAEPLSASADEEKLRHVILNLVDNAIKYSETGEIKITAAVEAEPSELSFRADNERAEQVEGAIEKSLEDRPRDSSPRFYGSSQKSGTQSDKWAGVLGIAVRVIDQGLGFAPEDHKNLFQKFQRGENVKATEMHTSSGLGLYIARQFVEGHKGQVWGQSQGLGGE